AAPGRPAKKKETPPRFRTTYSRHAAPARRARGPALGRGDAPSPARAPARDRVARSSKACYSRVGYPFFCAPSIGAVGRRPRTRRSTLGTRGRAPPHPRSGRRNRRRGEPPGVKSAVARLDAGTAVQRGIGPALLKNNTPRTGRGAPAASASPPAGWPPGRCGRRQAPPEKGATAGGTYPVEARTPRYQREGSPRRSVPADGVDPALRRAFR